MGLNFLLAIRQVELLGALTGRCIFLVLQTFFSASNFFFPVYIPQNSDTRMGHSIPAGWCQYNKQMNYNVSAFICLYI